MRRWLWKKRQAGWGSGEDGTGNVVEQNGKRRGPEQVYGAGLGHTAVREGWADPW